MTIPTIVVGDDIDATPDDVAVFADLLSFARRVAEGEAAAVPRGGPIVEISWTLDGRYLQLSQKGTGTFDDDSARIALFGDDHLPIVEMRIDGMVMLPRSSSDEQLRRRALLIAEIGQEVVAASAQGGRLSVEDAQAAGRAACHRARDHFDAAPHGSMSYSRQPDGGVYGGFVPRTSWRPMRLSVGGRTMPPDLGPTMPHMVGGSLTGRPRDVRSPALSVYPWDMAVDLSKSDALSRMRDEIVLERVSSLAEDGR